MKIESQQIPHIYRNRFLRDGGESTVNISQSSAGTSTTTTAFKPVNLWGRYFDDSEDITGDLENVGSVYADSSIFASALQISGDSSLNSVVSASHTPRLHDQYLLGNQGLRWLKVWAKECGIYKGEFDNLFADDASINTQVSNDITTHNLTVTGTAHFFELIIDKLRSVGGTVILSAANANIDKVETVTGGYKLWWRKEDAERAKAISNDFLVNDQIICQSFNVQTGISHNVSNKYYWRLVTATGDETTLINGESKDCNYIVVSDSVKDGASVPEVGDEIMQLGYRGTDDAERQSAIILSAYKTPDAGMKSPAIVQYVGINDFNLSTHRYSYQSANGNKFVGDFSIIDNGTVTDLTDYIINYVDTSISNNLTEFYRLKLTASRVFVDVSDNWGYYVRGKCEHVNGATVETVENASTKLSVKMIIGSTNEQVNPTWVSGTDFLFDDDDHIVNYSQQAQQPKTVGIYGYLNGQSSYFDSVLLPTVFDAGAIFTVTDNAIVSAVQQANAYTDSSVSAVTNYVSRVEQTANGLVSTVAAYSTTIDNVNSSIINLNSSVSQIAQTADRISAEVAEIVGGDYVSQSMLTQTASEIKAEINTSLGSTGIDITNQLITISATNTSINGNLNLYDDYNNGLTLFDANEIPRVNIQSDTIDSIATLANDSYAYYTDSADSYSFLNYRFFTPQEDVTLSQYGVLDLDKFTVYCYCTDGTSNYYPGSGATVSLTANFYAPGGTLTDSKTVTCQRVDSYGKFRNLSDKIRFSANAYGVYKVSYTVTCNNASTQGS